MIHPKNLPAWWHRKGISPDVAKCHKIKRRTKGISWPTPGGEKLKLDHPNGGSKNRWIKGSPQDIYNARAIIAAVGQLWFASGESEIWQLETGDIPAICLESSESGSIPPTLQKRLRDNGIAVLHLAPDHDDTGRKWAARIKAALPAPKYSVFTYSIADYWRAKFGEECPKHSDLGDLLEKLCIDPDTGLINPDLARAMLEELRRYPLHIEPEAPKPSKPRQVGQGGKLPSEPLEAIPAALGIDGYKGSGWSKPVPCPFGNHDHDDIRPSFGWHRDKHIGKCFKCAPSGRKHYFAKEVAAALGIDWKTPQDAGTPAHGKSGLGDAPKAPAPDGYHFPHGIPDKLREALLNLHLETSIKDHAPALVVQELRQHAIHAQHITPQAPITAKWLIDYAVRINWHTSQGVIRRGLKQLEALGFLAIKQEKRDGKGRPIDHYHPKPLTEALTRLREVLAYRIRERTFCGDTPDEITPEWFDNHAPDMAAHLAMLENARRKHLYKENEAARQQAEKQVTRAIRAMEAAFRLDSLLSAHSSTLVTDLACQKGSDYRVLYYRSKVASAEQRTIPRAKVAAQLGVSSKYISQLRVKARIVADEQFETMDITHTSDVQASVNETFPWAKNREFGKYLDNGKGERLSLSYHKPEEIDRWVKNELAHQRPVTAYIQTASRERLASEGEAVTTTRQADTSRQRWQSRPPMPTSDKKPDPLEELLAKAIEEASPQAFSIGYKLRQVALLPGMTEAELHRYIDLFSNCHPLETRESLRGGQYEKKYPAHSSLPLVLGDTKPPERDISLLLEVL